jgi:ferrous iron transport protein A
MKILFNMQINQQGVVTKISEENMPNKLKYQAGEIEARLLEMGFVEGCRVKIIHRGIFGGEPVAVRINNSNNLIALRKTEASAIFVMEDGNK